MTIYHAAMMANVRRLHLSLTQKGEESAQAAASSLSSR
jgi:hypothetical protein